LKVQTAWLFLCLTLPASAQYSGPALLSRGEAPAAMSGGPAITFRPFVEVTGEYSSGLANVSLNDQGQIANEHSFGGTLGWGVSGKHLWRHDTLGLDYRGGATHYLKHGGYDSIDQSLLLGYTHQFSRHATFSLRESAGILERNFGLTTLPETVPFDPATTFIPQTDYFDNRTLYTDTFAGLTLQKTNRLSFSASGELIANHRRSTALNSDTGRLARGDAQYRVSRRSTLGVGYTFMNMQFTNANGASDVHGVTLSYSVRLSRWVEISAYAGPMRVESKFVTTTQLDPAVQALLGIPFAQQVVYSVSYFTSAVGRISRTFRTGVLYAGGGRMVTPGNGLFMTSYGTTISAGYSYTGLRRWSFGTGGNYSRYDALGTVTGNYSGYSGNASLSRLIGHNAHFLASVSARQYGSGTFANYNRIIYESRIGFGYAPGSIPLRIW
jgi:hypothetical protein